MINLIGTVSAGLLFSLMLTGCEQQTNTIMIHPRIADRPDVKRIELHYTNDTKHYLCFSPAHWPNSTGALDSAGDAFALVVGSRRFPIENRSAGGYCVGDECSKRVAPGATISGFLRYIDFQLPAELEHEEKRLQYSIVAYQCDATGYWPKLKTN